MYQQIHNPEYPRYQLVGPHSLNTDSMAMKAQLGDAGHDQQAPNSTESLWPTHSTIRYKPTSQHLGYLKRFNILPLVEQYLSLMLATPVVV